MRVLLFIVRNTVGYATKDGRRVWTRELTHRDISTLITMGRPTVSTMIKRLKIRNIIKQDGQTYMFHNDPDMWKMSQKATVLESDNTSKKSRQIRSQDITKNVTNRNIDNASQLNQSTLCHTHKENNKEKYKKTIKESYKFVFKRQNLVTLLKKYTELYKRHAHKEYRNWQSENQNRDLFLFDHICSSVVKQKPTDCDENALWEYMSNLMEHYFSTNPIDAVKTGISGFSSKIDRLMGEYPWK